MWPSEAYSESESESESKEGGGRRTKCSSLPLPKPKLASLAARAQNQFLKIFQDFFGKLKKWSSQDFFTL